MIDLAERPPAVHLLGKSSHYWDHGTNRVGVSLTSLPVVESAGSILELVLILVVMADSVGLSSVCRRAIRAARAGACVILVDLEDDGRLEPMASAGEPGLVEDYLSSLGVIAARVPIWRLGPRAAELWRQNPATQRVLPLSEGPRLLGVLVLIYDAPVRMAEGVFDMADVVESGLLALQVERAERRAERLAHMLESLDVGVAWVDGGGEVRMASPAFGSLVGRRTTVGRQLVELFEPGVEFGPDPVDVEIRNARHHRLCSLRVVPVEPRGSVATLSEVGPVRALLAELEQRGEELAEANERLRHARAVERALLSAVAHELRNPLSILEHAFHLVRAHLRGPLDAELIDELDTIGEAASILERRIDDLVTFARLEVGALSIELDTYDLLEVIEGCRRSLCDARAELCVPDRGCMPVLVGDARRIRQVFENLLLNAQAHANHHILVEVGSTEEEVLVRVANDGDRIAPEDRQRVLEPFVRLTRLRSGMGLGLAIARGIIEAHGGSLAIVDDPLGVAVEVKLPLVVSRGLAMAKE